jgi:hypothetical protein
MELELEVGELVLKHCLRIRRNTHCSGLHLERVFEGQGEIRKYISIDSGFKQVRRTNHWTQVFPGTTVERFDEELSPTASHARACKWEISNAWLITANGRVWHSIPEPKAKTRPQRRDWSQNSYTRR